MFEMNISVNNGRYSGITEVYETSESLLKFTKELNGFPFEKDKISHSCGQKNSYAFFQMDLYKIGTSGICGAKITMEGNVPSDYNEAEKEKLSIELIIEPNAIDNFYQELKHLAINEDGTAELLGINKYSNNIA